MGYHARLSASGSGRWMPCPGSVQLCATLPKRKDHNYHACLGTAAHFLGEQCLKFGIVDADEFLGRSIHVRKWVSNPDDPEKREEHYHTGFRKGRPEKHWEEIYSYEFNVDDDMIEAVQVYLDYVYRLIDGATMHDISADLRIESWCSLEALGIDGLEGGTADTLIIFDNGDHGIEIVDYKNGQGHVVEVWWNSQLLCYALGALMEVEKELGREVDGVKFTIVQPRAFHPDGPVRSMSVSREDLMAWRDLDLIPCAEMTHDEDPHFQPGESQCFYCPASGGDCAAEIKYLEAEAGADFSAYVEPQFEEVTSDRLAQIVGNEVHIKEFFSKARTKLLERRKNGEQIPGWKLARSKKHRKLREEAEDVLFDLLDQGEIYREKIETLGAITKALKKNYGKAKAEEVMDEIAYKPEGDLILVRDSDHRPEEAGGADDDFKDYID